MAKDYVVEIEKDISNNYRLKWNFQMAYKPTESSWTYSGACSR
jgi:hypothetical protein